MRINEVEALTGLPKKSIRYYEAEGLLRPARESGNGYRRYSETEVETLLTIKALRKLDMPVDEIRRVLSGAMPLSVALARQRLLLERQHRDLETRRRLCARLEESAAHEETLDAAGLLAEMERMEQQGVSFHDFTRSDRKKAIRAVWFSAAAFALFMLAMAVLIWWENSVEPIPVWGFVLIEALFVVPAIGVFIAGRSRVKEIQGGEEDDLGNY